MKRLILIILSLFSLSTSSHANDKSVFECKSIVSNEIFNFFYTDLKTNYDGFIEADRNNTSYKTYSRNNIRSSKFLEKPS